jgi:hypothetical protein
MSASEAELQGGQPVYLYAIVPSAPDCRNALAGSDAIASGLTTIVAGPYCAVVGRDRAPDLKGRSREDLGRRLIAHQKVIEQLMRMAWVLPVKFGTRMPERAIRDLLDRGCPLLDSTFAEFKDCTQLEVSVTWDADAVLAEIAGQDAVVRLKAQIADNAQAVTPVLRLTLGRLVKAELERRRNALATHISEALRAVAIDAIASAVAADCSVLHLVLLVRIDALGEVDRCLETLDAAYGGRLCFRCIGPMPPANFAMLEIDLLDGDEIERAGRTLGVARAASLDDVRSAYRRLARAAHPDAADGGNGNAAAMAALSDAYRVLARYVRAREVDRREEDSCRPDSDVAARAVLSIRRQAAQSSIPGKR